MEEMKPGRELDALVASKVMGMSFDIGNGPMVMENFLGYIDEVCGKPTSAFASLLLLEKRKELNKKLPHYSTDIAAAWEVVEKIKKIKVMCDTHREECSNFTIEFADSDWWVEWRHCFSAAEDSCDESMYYSSSNSAAHAICLAALKAVGNE